VVSVGPHVQLGLRLSARGVLQRNDLQEGAEMTKRKLTVTRMTVSDMIEQDKDSPLPLHVIPNHMGINLCSVDSVSWTKQNDGQLVSLTIHFIPAPAHIEQAQLRRRARTNVSRKTR
jgi:hypothetical protein